MENKSLPLSEGILACTDLASALLTHLLVSQLWERPKAHSAFSPSHHSAGSSAPPAFSSFPPSVPHAPEPAGPSSGALPSSWAARGQEGPVSSACSQRAHSKWGARGKSVLTTESAGGKGPNSLLHFCLTPSLLLLHLLLPLFLSLLLLPEVLQSLPLLLLKEGGFRLYQVLGAVPPLRQPGTRSHGWSHSPGHRDGE